MTTNPTIDRQIEAFNRHDVEGFAARYAAEAVVNDPQFAKPIQGTAAITKDITDWFGTFPDVRSRAKRTVVSGNTYAAEWSMTGTQKGPLTGANGHIPATNKTVTVAVATIGSLDAQGRIVEETRYYDLASIMSQLGLMQ